MALHPDIEGFLELAEFGRLSGKSQPMHELNPSEARQQFEQTSQLLDAAPTGALTVKRASDERSSSAVHQASYRFHTPAP